MLNQVQHDEGGQAVLPRLVATDVAKPARRKDLLRHIAAEMNSPAAGAFWQL